MGDLARGWTICTPLSSLTRGVRWAELCTVDRAGGNKRGEVCPAVGELKRIPMLKRIRVFELVRV